MAKTYPIGVQSFEKLREEGYTYVDKTGFIHRLTQNGNCYFLSRPRRFGKSLLLSTIEAFFLGKKELFSGLAIYDHDHDWQPHPVLHIDLTAWKYDTPESLTRHFQSIFHRWECMYGIDVADTENIAERFRNIIEQAWQQTGQKVVILVDEYDKPLLDTVDNTPLQDRYRMDLKAVYGNLKKMDAGIEFAMLTGVTKFGKLSVFSDLNNLQDISFDNDYSAICGMTAEEIRHYYGEGVIALAENNALTVDEAYEELKKNYDGYHFSPVSTDIYNPFSLLNALSSRTFGSYWFATGTPTFLVEMIKREQMDLRGIEHLEAPIHKLMDVSFNLGNTIPVMYQSGYLTIKSYNRRFRTVVLDYPNAEVEEGFLNQLMEVYTSSRGRTEFDVRKFVLDVENGRIEDFMLRLRSLFSDYKYSQMDLRNLELHYRNVIYLVMKLMGFYTEAELQTASGRIDMLVRTPDYLYLFEFKLNRSAAEAMNQINARDYLIPFMADGRTLVKIGANFDDSTRTISEWLVEVD